MQSYLAESLGKFFFKKIFLAQRFLWFAPLAPLEDNFCRTILQLIARLLPPGSALLRILNSMTPFVLDSAAARADVGTSRGDECKYGSKTWRNPDTQMA